MEKIIESYVTTNVGKVRKNNEDNFYFYGHIVDRMQTDLSFSMEEKLLEPRLFGVFDGMGGHEAGEKASFMTAEIAKNTPLNSAYMLEILNGICYMANGAVCQEMRKVKQRIGTTASMLVLDEEKVCICNMGDSPIYLYRNHELTQLHEEHTERKMYERIYGHADPNKKYRLTQNIGIFEEEMLIKPYIHQIEHQLDDIYLICSDGLTDMISEDRIKNYLENFNQDTFHQLKDAAIKAGGRDNITIILIRIKSEEDQQQTFTDRIKNFFRK